MFDNARLLALIERALDADPYCPVCYAPNVVRDHHGRLWLECETAPTEPPTGSSTGSTLPCSSTRDA